MGPQARARLQAAAIEALIEFGDLVHCEYAKKRHKDAYIELHRAVNASEDR